MANIMNLLDFYTCVKRGCACGGVGELPISLLLIVKDKNKRTCESKKKAPKGFK
jgi:hypothetical protein